MKRTIILILVLIAATCQAETHYQSMVCAVVQDATLKEMAQIEEIVAMATGDDEPYFQPVQPIPDSGEAKPQDIPDERDI